jgi:hypothetical protein
MNLEVYEVHTLQHSHFCTLHINEHCGCSPHYLFLGRVGRSEVMHCIASFTLAWHCIIRICIALHHSHLHS